MLTIWSVNELQIISGFFWLFSTYPEIQTWKDLNWLKLFFWPFWSSFAVTKCRYFSTFVIQLDSQCLLRKTDWATTVMVFLSLMIDSERMIVAIPLDKVIKSREVNSQILNSKKTTVQQLCGYLSFVCRSILLAEHSPGDFMLDEKQG